MWLCDNAGGGFFLKAEWRVRSPLVPKKQVLFICSERFVDVEGGWVRRKGRLISREQGCSSRPLRSAPDQLWFR